MTDYLKFLPRILENYPVAIIEQEHLRTSENVVIKLLSDRGESYALRIRKIIGAYRDQIASELMFLRDLREQSNAEVPTPIATRDGRLFCVINIDDADYMCILFSWVAGLHVSAGKITESQMGAMADAVAQFHKFSSTYRPPPGFVRPVYDEQWYFGPHSWRTSAEFLSRLDPEHAAYLLKANDRVRERLRGYSQNADLFGLIHYDLHAGNFLFHENRANIIDFDECGFGYYLFDLAHILFEFIDDPRYVVFGEIAVKQYTQARPGPRISEADLNTFLALQCVAYVNWMYRLFWRDNNAGAMNYWIPIVVRRLRALLHD